MNLIRRVARLEGLHRTDDDLLRCMTDAELVASIRSLARNILDVPDLPEPDRQAASLMLTLPFGLPSAEWTDDDKKAEAVLWLWHQNREFRRS